MTNADLPFDTRQLARDVPRVLHDARQVDCATGMLAALHRISVDDARSRLRAAAGRAGLPMTAVAEAVIALRGEYEL